MKNISKLFLSLICLSLYSCASAQNAVQTTAKTDSLAEKMLVYQLSNGAWGKQLDGGIVVNYDLPLTQPLLDKIKATTYMHATIDNKATSREIVALVKAYKTTQNKTYLQAAERGLDYLFKAQYANGGWPQYYPDKSSYRAQVTYNDDAIINVLNIMQNIATQTNDFDVVDKSYIVKAQTSLKKGLDCIIKTQVTQNGKLSIWAAQYDPNTLIPAKARAFEPASLSTAESVSIVKFLMKFNNPSAEIKTAINSAMVWFENSKISGYKFEKLADGKDKGLIADANATIWARFYDIKTNKPIFGDRDNSIKSNVADISYERRNGYGWYGTWGNSLIEKDYPKWQKVNP